MESAPFLTRRSRPRGFTLVEMLVVLAIIAVITTIVITGQSTYNKTLLLTDTTYGVALSGRQAQSFGLASRKFGNVQNPGYGLFFSNAKPTTYTLYADTNNTAPAPADCPVGTPGTPEQKPGNCRWDGSGTDGLVTKFTLERGFYIKQFCAKQGSGSNVPLQCSTDPSPILVLNLVFTRPNTSTVINGVVGPSLLSYSCAQVTIADASGQATRTVRFSSLGEIAVNQVCP